MSVRVPDRPRARSCSRCWLPGESRRSERDQPRQHGKVDLRPLLEMRAWVAVVFGVGTNGFSVGDLAS